MDAGQMGDVLNNITPTLNYGDFKNVDLVVEAVVENPKVKDAVLRETEDAVREDAILTSNTSTISINLLAKNLKRPENFCGIDRKSTRLNSSHVRISYAVFCLKKKSICT